MLCWYQIEIFPEMKAMFHWYTQGDICRGHPGQGIVPQWLEEN